MSLPDREEEESEKREHHALPIMAFVAKTGEPRSDKMPSLWAASVKPAELPARSAAGQLPEHGCSLLPKPL